MGYPMTYPRVVNRNGLTGSYARSGAKGLSDDRASALRMIAGDLRRLEQDSRDPHQIKRIAEEARVSKPKAKAVLDAFFTDCGFAGIQPWLGAEPHRIET